MAVASCYSFGRCSPSQQHPGYLLSRHVPPKPPLFSRMIKLRHLFLLIKSIAVHMPLIPPPMITTAASVWFLFPTDTCGQGMSPPILFKGNVRTAHCEGDVRRVGVGGHKIFYTWAKTPCTRPGYYIYVCHPCLVPLATESVGPRSWQSSNCQTRAIGNGGMSRVESMWVSSMISCQ